MLWLVAVCVVVSGCASGEIGNPGDGDDADARVVDDTESQIGRAHV